MLRSVLLNAYTSPLPTQRALRLSTLVLLDQLFVVASAALVAVPERAHFALAAVALSESSRVLFVRAPARRGVQRRLEALAVDGLLYGEVAAVHRVLGLLRVAEAHPPILARRVHALRARLRDDSARRVGARVVVRDCDHDGAPAP